MLINFFQLLKQAGLPVSIRELLDLLEALKHNLVFANVDEFYYLSRSVMVKDEKYYDRFDKAFSSYFNDLQSFDDLLEAMIPEEWLRKEFERFLSDEEKAKIQSLGGLEKIMEEFKKRIEEQKEKHKGGNKWIGTGGTSPFGHGGFNPEGIRVGGQGGNKKAVKVWDKREFKNLDDSVELGTRNIKVALRRLRKFAREGNQDELDLDSTISSTAKNAGLLDIHMRPERHNAVKVLLFFDVGGSMDPFIRQCEELFSAARIEFKHMKYFYFHNFIYESVWDNNFRRTDQAIRLEDVINRYSRDYKLIFVGDASMSPYEILAEGGSVEYWNQQSGKEWMQKLHDHFEKKIWLNPIPEESWSWTQSIEIVKTIFDNKMYPLTVKGIEEGMRFLSK